MNRKTESVIRKFKDAQHNYIWQPGVAAGQAPTLLGYPVAEAEDMPDIASNSFSIAFGDFKRGYLIVDRIGVKVLRDPYSAKPYVLFYTTKRVGGGAGARDQRMAGRRNSGRQDRPDRGSDPRCPPRA